MTQDATAALETKKESKRLANRGSKISKAIQKATLNQNALNDR